MKETLIIAIILGAFALLASLRIGILVAGAAAIITVIERRKRRK